MNILFKQTKSIVTDIERFLDNIEKVAAHFELSIREYFNQQVEQFEERCRVIKNLEHENDTLRGKIKTTLYTELLIPDARGDVLGLIENLDKVLGVAEHVTVQLSIEQPTIYPFLKDDFIALVEAASKSVSELVMASRAFFKEPRNVQDHIGKIHFWETEADKIEDRIKRKTFASQEILQFSKKIHMRYFAEKISLFADEAEDVAERLEVYAIKRAF